MQKDKRNSASDSPVNPPLPSDSKTQSPIVERLKNISVEQRDAILSEDIANIVSFIGQDIDALEIQNIDDMRDIIIARNIERRDGDLIENNIYHIDKKSGLVRVFHRESSPNNNASAKITSSLEIYGLEK